jgi:putative transposase
VIPTDVRAADRQEASAAAHRGDEIVLSLTTRGLTTGEIAAHFQQVYGAKMSKDTVSRITEKVIGEMTEWLNRPVYPVIFIDVMVVKVRDGQVANKPVYVVIGDR